MLRTQNRGTKAMILGMAGATLAVGAVAYQASGGSTSTSASSAGLMAAETRPNPNAAPAALTPPAGLRPIASFTVASGTQTYTCANGSFAGASVPEAQLVGPRRSRIHHFGGPSWQATDGSLITATKTAESAVAGSIPQLLLTVNSHSGATGLLTRVQNIQRLSTSGGTAPTTACTDGEKVAVPYKARYVFWAN